MRYYKVQYTLKLCCDMCGTQEVVMANGTEFSTNTFKARKQAEIAINNLLKDCDWIHVGADEDEEGEGDKTFCPDCATVKDILE